MSPRKSYRPPPPLQLHQFRSREEIDKSIRKLERRISDVEALDRRSVGFGDAKVDSVEHAIQNSILEIYGENSPEYRAHRYHKIWEGGYNLGDTPLERQQKFASGIPQTKTMLEGLIAGLREKLEDLPGSGMAEPNAGPDMAVAAARRVFVVHGHDVAARDAVARVLTQLELEPVILQEQTGGGRTLIEKMEAHSGVPFAVVILSPDDEGHPVGKPEERRNRARQNVIYELGYFVGKIGRSRVCALHKGDVEILSDYEGVEYIPMDEGGAWRHRLGRELQDAGIAVDLNRLR